MGDEPKGTALLAAVLGSGKEEVRLSPRQSAVLRRILACGTGELGCHVYRCEECGEVHAAAHSCRDRHCPRCQRARAEQWLERQRESLLPAPYFHVVFTLPHRLNDLVAQNPRRCLNLLFHAAGSTVTDFGRNNLGAELGATAVLHTWGQTMTRHYHVHLIVTGGGLSESGDEWIGGANRRWLFSTRALAEVYRARYLEGLEALHRRGELEFHGKLREWGEENTFARQLRTWSRRSWNVYAKAPFAGPDQVLGYLARYTHRVAISGGRLLRLDAGAKKVTFRYRDYRKDGHPWRETALGTAEFTRRFAQHILPKGFCKIRHYGLLSTRNRRERVPLARYYLAGSDTIDDGGPAENPENPSGGDDGEAPVRSCPHCGSARMVLVGVVAAPPRQQHGNPKNRGRSPPRRIAA